MHVSLLFITIALAGQLSGNSGGDRYSKLGADSAPPAPPSSTLEITSQDQDSQAVLQPFADSTPGEAARPQLPSTGNQELENRAQPLNTAPQPGVVASPKIDPSQIMQSFLEEPIRDKLVGTPWALADVVQGARSRSEQTRRVEAYWDLTAAVAHYNLTLQDMVWLKTLQASIAQPGPQWGQALQSLEARVQTTGRTAKVAQHRLQHLLGRSDDESLPLPSEVPLCGEYGTRYNEIFAGRTSKHAGQLNTLLSLNHQAIQSRADGVADASQWLKSVDATRNPNTDGRGLLKAYELLSLRRCALVDAVRDYNVNIANYSELATPGEVSTGRLVAMLIPVSAEQRLNWESQGIKHASAEESLGSRPRTFADGEPSATRRSETPQDGVQRSIIAPPPSGQR